MSPRRWVTTRDLRESLGLLDPFRVLSEMGPEFNLPMLAFPLGLDMKPPIRVWTWPGVMDHNADAGQLLALWKYPVSEGWREEITFIESYLVVPNLKIAGVIKPRPIARGTLLIGTGSYSEEFQIDILTTTPGLGIGQQFILGLLVKSIETEAEVMGASRIWYRVYEDKWGKFWLEMFSKLGYVKQFIGKDRGTDMYILMKELR